MDKKYADYLLKKTREDYNLISEDFSRTRKRAVDESGTIKKHIGKGEKILDLGCGNGRIMDIFRDQKVEYVGVDNSEKLIELARKKHPEGRFLVADALRLPFSENYFDRVISIGVFHHLPSEKYRLKFLNEAKRVLKRKGMLIIRVWDFWRNIRGWKLILKYTFLTLIKKERFDFKDIFYPWRDSSKKAVAMRYFHCFTKMELEDLANKCGFLNVRTWREGEGVKSNIYLVAEKP